ncbi:hypothetical protein LTR36_004505 [Oleoguttula mirabilis]|uniref:Cytochrome P450 n=1 Tax=Oleoguttula mirabilis TaxID=1507867 RepID=A0AAV9JGU4_9PEZI|nr:hypothetical protein LTR36_004505 [Oleoguttula mirabilis]
MAARDWLTEYQSSGYSQPLLLLLLPPSVLLCAAWLYLRYLYVDFAPLKGIPEIPGGSLLYGHLKLLGKDHATTAQQWAEQYGWPIFQVRLGYRRVVFLNGFQVAREWLVTHQAATIDRPTFYTFHGVVSKTSAATVGTNPWNERTKKQRLVVGSLTTAPAIQRLASMIDLETSQMVKSIFQASKIGSTEVMPHLSQKRLALNIVLMFCYGRRFDDIDDPLLLGILRDASLISTFRSTSGNAQDYVPYLRYLPSFLKDKKRMAMATEVRTRRDKWLASLLQEVEDNIAVGQATNCVAAGLLTDTDGGITNCKALHVSGLGFKMLMSSNADDVRTILGGLMSGGFETVFSTTIAGIAYLASPDGQIAQQRAYDDIVQSYGSPTEAFDRAVHEEKSSYMVAFVRETLRCYPPSHLLPPRQMFKDCDCGGVQVPKGLMVLVNCQSVNRDPATYGPDAHLFRPERWLDKDTPYNVPPPYEFAFGAGTRGCTAINFSNRILYATFVRLITTFRIRQSEKQPPCLHYIDYNCDTSVTVACPKDFKASFQLRDRKTFDASLARSQEKTISVTNGIVK